MNNKMPENKSSKTIAIPERLERGIDQIDNELANKANLVLDFSECTFVSVEGLEWLEELLMRAESYSMSVQLIKMNPTIYKVFKVARVRNILAACGSPIAGGSVC